MFNSFCWSHFLVNIWNPPRPAYFYFAYYSSLRFSISFMALTQNRISFVSDGLPTMSFATLKCEFMIWIVSNCFFFFLNFYKFVEMRMRWRILSALEIWSWDGKLKLALASMPPLWSLISTGFIHDSAYYTYLKLLGPDFVFLSLWWFFFFNKVMGSLKWWFLLSYTT